LTAEKLLTAYTTGESRPVFTALDATISFQSPIGVYHGRPFVKPWIEFEVEMMRPFAHLIRHHGTVAEDGLKVGRLMWSVGGIYITDVVTQTQVLTIRSVKRTLRRDCKSQSDHDIAEALLLAWTGPHFSKFCAGRGRQAVDNRALVLPVLDYSFENIRNTRMLLIKEPHDGRAISDDSVVFHFLQEAVDEEKQAAEATKQVEQQHDGETEKQNFGESSASAVSKRRATTVTIQARNRNGDVNAIIIDRSALDGKGSDQTRLDALEDAELQVRRDRSRYVCSGIRLANNDLTQAKELDHVLRIFVVNAFYFITMIDISSNKLVEIPDLGQLLSLQTLYLHDNQLSDWNQLDVLKNISQLSALTLFGNPLQQNAESAKAYKFNALYYFFSADGYRVFHSRQQTLQNAATSSAASTRPSSRASNVRPGTSDSMMSSVGRRMTPRSPSPIVAAPPRAPTPALASRAIQHQPDGPAPTFCKLKLRQFDHCVVSPLEVEALEGFIPVIKRRLKRATSPVIGDLQPGKGGGTKPSGGKPPTGHR
jgi:hypothetical protein